MESCACPRRAYRDGAECHINSLHVLQPAHLCSISRAHRIGDADPHSVAFVVRVALWSDVQNRTTQACITKNRLLDICRQPRNVSGLDAKLLHRDQENNLASAAGARSAVAKASVGPEATMAAMEATSPSC